jgi:hypothetical protein
MQSTLPSVSHILASLIVLLQLVGPDQRLLARQAPPPRRPPRRPHRTLGGYLVRMPDGRVVTGSFAGDRLGFAYVESMIAF